MVYKPTNISLWYLGVPILYHCTIHSPWFAIGSWQLRSLRGGPGPLGLQAVESEAGKQGEGHGKVNSGNGEVEILNGWTRKCGQNLRKMEEVGKFWDVISVGLMSLMWFDRIWTPIRGMKWETGDRKKKQVEGIQKNVEFIADL